jgi:hypothetical protein
MTRIRAGAVALLLTAGTGLAVHGAMGPASAASAPAPTAVPAPVVTPVSPAESFVGRAYADLMGRPADPAGKAFWVQQVNQGMPHASVAGSFTQTDSYRHGVVDRAYIQTLGHNADPGGMQYWTGFLAKGGRVDQMTGSLVGTADYASQFGVNHDALVQAMYKDLLGRPAEPAGLAFWDARLAAGDPSWHVAASLTNSYEWYQNRVVYDYVLYHVGFPDAAGLSFWAHSMQSGMPETRIVAGIVGSDTYAAFASTHQ